ncbi:hypothetical protein HDV02_005212 [Globomyces sp. JEL0801]|nr:hypothetical protein HDV02_005212 [Globomyces sp. JEL0801]
MELAAKVAMIIQIVAIIADIITLYRVSSGWLKNKKVSSYITTVLVLDLIWQISLLTVNALQYQPGWCQPIHNIAGYLMMLFYLLSSIEIFKLFLVISNFWTVKRMIVLKNITILLHFLFTSGGYICSFTLLLDWNPPAILTLWSAFGNIAWSIYMYFVIAFQYFYLTYLIKLSKKCKSKSSESRMIDKRYVDTNIFLVFMAVFAIFVISLAIYPTFGMKSANPELLFAVKSISKGLLGIYATFLCYTFKLLKYIYFGAQVFQTTSEVKKSSKPTREVPVINLIHPSQVQKLSNPPPKDPKYLDVNLQH